MKNPKIIIAPDSFKETLTAAQAARAIRTGFKRILPGGEYELLPVADGGEGTLDSVIGGAGGKRIRANVTGPLGEMVNARYGIISESRTAVIEMAQASGLELVPEKKRNPEKTTTYGTGELIRKAWRKGVRRILLTIGGSATVDGGTGLAQALGVLFRDKQDRIIKQRGGGILGRIHSIDLSSLLVPAGALEIEIACDVRNPIMGPSGAARIFGPQKGAKPAQVERLEKGMRNYIGIMEKQFRRKLQRIPGGGAAGGIGIPLICLFGAKNRPGIDMVLETIDFRKKIKGADLIITGEGKMDGQSIFGKTPVGVAQAASEQSIPVIAINGCLGEGAQKVHKAGIAVIFSATPRGMSFDEVKANASKNLSNAAEEAARALVLGGRLGLRG